MLFRSLSVKDDGCGIRPNTQPGMGLTGMEERVRALGGTFMISKQADGGTSLDITIPVESVRSDEFILGGINDPGPSH